MELVKSDIKTTKNIVNYEVLVSKIKMGKSILFTGAGFSLGAVNSLGQAPMSAKKLSHLLAKKSGLKENDNLMFTSEYYLSNMPPQELIELLKDNYTLSNTSESQDVICSLPWRRAYTTNYDRSVEIASLKAQRRFETIDIKKSYGEASKPKNLLCVHLNGSIDILDEETLNTTFKLSDSSYMSAESFLNSEWNYGFKKDLERASVIVFVGYSLYDIDVKKLLFSDDSLKDKTYFITAEEPDVETNFTLSKYGTVLTIGTDGFAKKILEYDCLKQPDFDYELQSLRTYEISGYEDEVRDNDVEKLLLFGEISKPLIDSCILGEIKVPFLIKRSYEEQSVNCLHNGKNVIFYGALGNGKSLLLSQLKVQLSKREYDVYTVDDLDADIVSDIELISKNPVTSVLFLDDYEQYLDVIEYIAKSDFENIFVIASARIADHEYLRPKLLDFGFNFEEFNIDLLNDDEVGDIVDIFENLGHWADRATTRSDKVKYIKRKNESQISLSLIDFMGSPVIKERLKRIVSFFEKNVDYKTTLLAICLCKIIGVPSTKSLISEVSGNDTIYEPDLTNSNEFRQLFRVENSEINNLSSILSVCLISDCYNASSVTKNLLRIAKKFESINSRNHFQERIFKSMLKFSFIEKVMPPSTKIGNLQRYYEELKVNIPWLRNNPHFWLQYAMTFIAFRDYNKAQQMLDQAYDLAESKSNYHTDNIDTQQARLWLSCCNAISDGKRVYSNFEKAHKLLKNLGDDIYKYRQVSRYREFYDENFVKFSKSDKSGFISKCKQMLSVIDKLLSDGNEDLYYLKKSRDKLLSIPEVAQV
tara:strand:- start:476 stop:2923 length:2448 start_codon:yes stop_codon:yes gene_type:complete